MFFFFFFNDTAPTEIYTLSLHDALPISVALHSNINIYINSQHNRHRLTLHRRNVRRLLQTMMMRYKGQLLTSVYTTVSDCLKVL